MFNKGNGKVIWLFGRPCSGKTTIANCIAIELKEMGVLAITLDGDEMRSGLNSDLGYSLIDRYENIRRASELARILAKKGFWVVCSFITPTNAMRNLVEDINYESELKLIYIYASLAVCKERDVKGHYSKVANGQLSNFTGISSPFEDPDSESNIINTNVINIQETTKKCLSLICNSLNEFIF